MTAVATLLLLCCISTAHSFWMDDDSYLDEPYPANWQFRQRMEPPSPFHDYPPMDESPMFRSMSPSYQSPKYQGYGSYRPASNYELRPIYFINPYSFNPYSKVQQIHYVTKDTGSESEGEAQVAEKPSKEPIYIPANINGALMGPILTNSVPTPLYPAPVPEPGNSIEDYLEARSFSRFEFPSSYPSYPYYNSRMFYY